jgi:hypothetical protein
MGYALLLVAGTLSAQSKPFQLFPPKSTQNSVTKQVLDAAKLPLDLGRVPVPQVTNCAIPLMQVPIPAGQNFTGRRVTPSPSIDPKITVKPALPACVTSLRPSPSIPGR